MHRSVLVTAACVLCAGEAAHAGVAPVVFWASSPVRPGEAVLVTGSGLDDGCTVEVCRLADAAPQSPAPAQWSTPIAQPTVLQARGQSLKFVLPGEQKPGVFALRVRSGKATSATVLLNGPSPWWCQGDAGTKATPGGYVRVFGNGLGWPGIAPGGGKGKRSPASTIRLKGPRAVVLAAEGGRYAIRSRLPSDLAPGQYELRVHNGRGGAGAWSAPLRLDVVKPDVWPKRTLNVMDFGANGRGKADDTRAIADALAKLGSSGGGVLYFPRGRYLVSQTLRIPERTVLRGAGRDLSAIAWPDRAKPLERMLVGTHHFAIRDLSFYCANYGHFLTVDMTSPQAGHVHLQRLRVVANRFRGHMYQRPEEMSARFTRFGVHGGKLLALRGDNVEVTDCDLLASGCVLFLSRAPGARIANNTFRMGRFGWFWLSGCDGVAFENNRCLGQDLSTWGGGINVLDGSASCRHVYFANNTCAQWFGGDNELTTDGSGSFYFGKAASGSPTGVVTASDPGWGGRRWRGLGVFIVGGRGVGQYRRVADHKGRAIEVDRPWQVVPDHTSQLAIVRFQGRFLLIGNRFADIGVVQFYGTSAENICDGNVSARTAGFYNMARDYHGLQPSWYVQWLGNVIEEGNGYDSAHRQLPRDARLGVVSAVRSARCPHAMNLGTVVRGNRLLSNARIALGDRRPAASIQDCIVEGNTVRDSDVGIDIAPLVAGVLQRNNTFERVGTPVLNRAGVAREAEAMRQRIAGAKAPIGHWSFADARDGVVPDRSDNHLDARVAGGRLQVVRDGPDGAAARFDGTTYLQVGAENGPKQNLLNQHAFSLSVWVKPDRVTGRQGLLTKRLSHAGPPFVLSIFKGTILFEAADEAGKWVYNFGSKPIVTPGRWQHLAAAVEDGKGVTIYYNGHAVARNDVREKLVFNWEPLVIGREPWGGPDKGARGPVFYKGLMGPITIWARALSADEIATVYRAGTRR